MLVFTIAYEHAEPLKRRLPVIRTIKINGEPTEITITRAAQGDDTSVEFVLNGRPQRRKVLAIDPVSNDGVQFSCTGEDGSGEVLPPLVIVRL
jgi:hypothetical protein